MVGPRKTENPAPWSESQREGAERRTGADEEVVPVA